MKNNNGESKMGAFFAGAALGAVAATLINGDSRKKVKDGIKNALEVGDEKLNEVSKRANQLKKKAKVKAVKELRNTEKKLADSM